MRPILTRAPCIALGLALALAFAPVALAQIARGNIYGAVVDPTGALLPGATITLSGPLGTHTTTSDTQGEFRFLNVDQGTHTLTVELMGFAGHARDIVLRTGENLNLSFALQLAGVAETVTITAETPVVDTKKVGTATVIALMPSHR